MAEERDSAELEPFPLARAGSRNVSDSAAPVVAEPEEDTAESELSRLARVESGSFPDSASLPALVVAYALTPVVAEVLNSAVSRRSSDSRALGVTCLEPGR